VRVVLSGKAGRVGDVPASISSIAVDGKIIPPAVKEIRLQSYPGIPMRWSTNLAGASAIFTADIENAAGLASGGNELCIQGVAGYLNTVNITQKFVCDSGIDLGKITTRNIADSVNYGSSNSLAVSLDGKSPLFEKSTSGKANGDDLVIDLSGDERFKNVTEFYVHMTMSCGAGVVTPIVSRITMLSVDGTGFKARN
jgi:hypothetical protein